MFTRTSALTLDSVTLGGNDAHAWDGPRLLGRLLDTAADYVGRLRERIARRELPARVALFGRVRGTGPGVSFTRYVEALQTAFPVPLQSPFEKSETVAGAVLEARTLIAPHRQDALLVLRFDAGSRDLPMHAHEDSERFIYVVGGRGYFHVAAEEVHEFRGRDIRHVPVRASDLIMFSRGTVHTFSTDREPLTLLSYHGPYVPLTDERQYIVPTCRVCPGQSADPSQSHIACDAAWTCMS